MSQEQKDLGAGFAYARAQQGQQELIKQIAYDWSRYGEDQEDVSDIAEVLFYEYTYEDYSGNAFLLYRSKDGKLMECNGGHCSCDGLEGQWSPEETSKEALEKRFEPRPYDSYSYGYPHYIRDIEKLRKIIADLPPTVA